MKKQVKKKAARKSVALARRPKPLPSLVKKLETRVKKLEVVDDEAQQELQRRITDGIELGAFGVANELKLTVKEEEVLARPVNLAEIRIKPSGQPYLSHPTYTRWFNEAFGRTGWQLVPIGKPMLQGKSVVQPYLLHVHRTPIALAYGEQEYHDNNREQTYGDALEATHASALRRCAKHLGVALEMWDRDYLDDFINRQCVRVKVKQKDGTIKYAWRRESDPALPYEIGRARSGEEDIEPAQRQERPRYDAPRDSQPPAGHHAQRGERISDKQKGRLMMIVKNSGREEEEVRAWIQRLWNWLSYQEITRDVYDYVCSAVESPGGLPAGR